MWNVAIIRVYRDEGSSYEYTDKVYFEVDSLEKINDILSVFDKYAVGEYKYMISQKKRRKPGGRINV